MVRDSRSEENKSLSWGRSDLVECGGEEELKNQVTFWGRTGGFAREVMKLRVTFLCRMESRVFTAETKAPLLLDSSGVTVKRWNTILLSPPVLLQYGM